jgi:hypothetical protein
MVTADTPQVISGIKTFPPGTLLMRRDDGTTHEPYSDANPPRSLERVLEVQQPTPRAGTAVEWTPDGKSLYMRAPDGTITMIGPTAATGGGADFTIDYTTTTPATPTTGVVPFSRFRARRLLATIGPSGQDTSYQPAFFANRIALVRAINGVAAPSAEGVATTAISTPTAIANASTNFYTSMVKTRYSSTATAGTAGGLRSTTSQWFLSSTANMGGFFFVCRFGLGAATATNRVFVGLMASTANPGNVNPSTFTNMLGFGCDASQTTFRIMHNASAAAATMVDLGTDFPSAVSAAGTNFYEARLFAPSAGGSSVRWSMTRLNDGAMAQGIVNTNLPPLGTAMSSFLWHNNGTTAAVASIDLQSLYIETDN